ncbi:MAG TPA: hypothetical protein DEH25_14650 [Chloroflexi bacterium]|nr:hypothetical protein [Chloroflexota bacterium]
MAFPKRIWVYFSLLLFVAVIGIMGQRASAQAENARYFPETGHWVTGEFLTKYEGIDNPLDIYGAPITESFLDADSKLEFQYFEKARFEFDPDAPAGLRVKLSPLGEALYEAGAQISVPTNAAACRAFVQTGYSVCYAFLDFFEENGATAQFGYPISGFESHDGWIVQYFQNARFEWHPENPAGKYVTISNLGYRYFYDQREDPTLLNTVPQDQIPNLPVLGLQTHAFASIAILPLSGTQTLFVIVQDEYHNPIEGAEVNFSVILPDGSTESYQAPRTNQAGVSTQHFEVHANRPGIVNILVQVRYNATLTAKTRTSFSLWW